MSETIIVAILSLIGTLAGSLLGIIAANKLVIYRIEQLEAVIKEEIKVANHRIDDLESNH